jgi:MYXO-CTERM domain-containing protein
MKNLKLMMFAAAGLLAPAVTAQADVARITQAKMVPSPTTDLAEVSGTPARLRRQNERQPGNEDTSFTILPDGKTGVYFSMATELNGVRAFDRIQLAAVPFVLKQDATGAVIAEPNMAAAKFITRNDGNEYRNANVPEGFAVEGAACVAYNWQEEGGSDTKRYVKCVDATTLAEIMPQTLVMAKNNDDCSMHQDGAGISLIRSAGGKNVFAMWAGCNGNGRDDAWYNQFSVDKQTDGKLKLTKQFDVSILAREERSRGRCIAPDPADLKFVVCGGTEGNTQPQRDGTWLIGIDADETKYKGANQQNAIIWKNQIGGRKTVGGRRTYSMRASIQTIMQPDVNGRLTSDGTILFRQGALEGNNNTNGKGGTYYGNEIAVMKVSRAGMTYVTPMKDIAPMLLGLDGTHLKFEYGMFGTVGALKPGFIFHSGSHTGGGYASQARVVMWDALGGTPGTNGAATGEFKDGGSFGIATHDRHLYPNYTGNNPGNQGRNHADGELIANPFVGTAGNTDAYLMVVSTSGKDQSEMADPKKKLSAFLTIMPVAQQPVAAPPPAQPQPSGQTDDPATPEDETQTGGAGASDEALGGCSTGGGSAGFLSLLLIGLAAFIRRRR